MKPTSGEKIPYYFLIGDDVSLEVEEETNAFGGEAKKRFVRRNVVHCSVRKLVESAFVFCCIFKKSHLLTFMGNKNALPFTYLV